MCGVDDTQRAYFLPCLYVSGLDRDQGIEESNQRGKACARDRYSKVHDDLTTCFEPQPSLRSEIVDCIEPINEWATSLPRHDAQLGVRIRSQHLNRKLSDTWKVLGIPKLCSVHQPHPGFSDVSLMSRVHVGGDMD